jgi:hypothetical protein
VRSHDLNRLLNKPGSGFPANSFLTPCPKVGGLPGSVIGRCLNQRLNRADLANSAADTPFSGIFRPSAAVAPVGAPPFLWP